MINQWDRVLSNPSYQCSTSRARSTQDFLSPVPLAYKISLTVAHLDAVEFRGTLETFFCYKIKVGT